MTNFVANTFETNSRKLEQFLFLHDIHHISWRKDDDGMTVWEYPRTKDAVRVVDEYREIIARRTRNQTERSVAKCM